MSKKEGRSEGFYTFIFEHGIPPIIFDVATAQCIVEDKVFV